MTKYHPYSRRVWRSRLADWGRRNRRLIAGATAVLLALIAAETVLVTVILTPTAFTWWLLGVFQATMVAAYLHILHAAFLATDREAIWHLRGAWGEDNTRSELQRAKRKRLIWGWVDSINLQAGDLDHLVVTRRGGLVAIDSKWRNQANDTVEMAKAARRVRTRAEGLAQSLLKTERGARHRAKENPLRVLPLVVPGALPNTRCPNTLKSTESTSSPASDSCPGSARWTANRWTRAPRRRHRAARKVPSFHP